jgi:autotransporter translocation and assembly factor TamB
VAVRGQAHVADETRVAALVDASRVDLARLVSNAPSSSLALHAELAARMPPSGELAGDYRVDVPAGRIAAVSTPRLETSGRVSLSREGELRIAGQATVDETDAPLEVTYDVRSKEGGVSAHAELDGRLREPPRLAAVGVRASGTVRALADFDSRTSLIDAKARMRLGSVRHEAVRARALALNASVHGTASDPELAADFTAGPVEALGRRFSAVAATVSGKPSRLAVHALAEGENPERIEVETEVSLAGSTELDGTRVTLFGSEDPLELSAAKVALADGAVRVDRFAVRGAGTAQGSFAMNGPRQHVELTASELDLGRIARLAGVRMPFEQANVSADISLERRPGALEGHARARATKVKIGKLDTAEAALDLAFTPKDVSGTVDADFGDGGRFHVALERFEPPREPWTLARFANQPGALKARGDLRLAGFLPLVEAAGLPIQRLGGRATFDVKASGGKGGVGPKVEARLATKELQIVEKRTRPDPIRTAQQARELEPRALDDVDVKLAFELEPTERRAVLDVELYDPYGTIVKANGETRLPEDWTRTLARAWRTLPVRATLEMPRRPFEIFPTVVRPTAVKGIAAALIKIEGTAAAPAVDGEVVLDRFRVRRDDELMKVALQTHYDPAGGKVTLAAETRGRTVGTLEASWRGDAARVASVDPNGRSPIELELEGELREFPLDSIPALADRQIEGPLSGTFSLEGLGKNAKLDVSLDGSKVKVGQVRMERLTADVAASDGRVRVHVLGGDRTGTAELDFRTAAAWGNRLVPSMPTEAEGRLTAKAFRLEALKAALAGALNEIGGRLDADLTVKLAPGNNALSGQASIREGVVQLPAVGERFTGIRADVRIEGDRVYLRDAEARGPTGRLTARATARLDGLALKAAEAHIRIKEREKLPVTLEGAALGDAWGRFAVLYRQTEDATEVRVDVPSLHVELAEQGDLEVQSLEDVESIRIGARLPDGTFTTLPVQPLEDGGDESESSSPMKVRIRLGDVEVKKGLMLQVKLGGDLLMTSGEESRMTGRLELKGGKLDVQGKLFDVERGVITFAGDPSNPTITATARWDSPVGYTVYADYSGDVENGQIKLRSEPPLNQDEITSLLMFGDPEGSVGTGSGNTNSAATAVGVAGDTAAKGINRALSDLTSLDVAARVDTSTGTARPELVVQISPRVAARVTRAVGEPQAGQPPDRTFLTVEFRFTRSWSVSGVVGDHGGSGVDVIWRRRY